MKTLSPPNSAAYGIGEWSHGMRLITGDKSGFELRPYLEYLERIRDKLPRGTFAFALASWHYAMHDHKCPHDSWVEALSIKELGTGERDENRTLQISAEFLGAFHDCRFMLRYENVSSYALQLKRSKRKQAHIGHGDWLIDEIILDDVGMVTHEILFSDSGLWRITCEDVLHEWLPFTP